MTIFCLLSRPWLIPYAEGESRHSENNALAAFAWTHLDACAHCQAESARLRAMQDALQSAASASRRRHVQDDLGSTLFAERVMTRVYQNEQLRRQMRLRQQRRVTTTLSLAFSLAVMGFAFTAYGPPSFAHTWFMNTFHPVPVHAHRIHHKKAVSEHDAFGAHRHRFGSDVARKPKNQHHDLTARLDSRPASRSAEPNSILDTQSPSASIENAHEATIVAEEAERARLEKTRVTGVPAPSGAHLTASGSAP